MLATCIAIQAIALAVLAFADIGFDIRGRFGMSFEHAVLCMAAYLGALITGMIVALRRRRWVIASCQAIVPVLIILYVLWPAPHLTASHYQHLVGQPKRVVERVLGVRHTVSGRVSHDRREFEFVSYNGLTVYYNRDCIVDCVEPSP